MICNFTLVILQLTERFLKNEQKIKGCQHTQSPSTKVASIWFGDRRIIYLKNIGSIWSLNFDPPLLPVMTRSIFPLGIFIFSATTDIPLTICHTKIRVLGVKSKNNLKRI